MVDQVIEHLNNEIAAGKYGMGTKLPAEPPLVEELGVGRSTLREGLYECWPITECWRYARETEPMFAPFVSIVSPSHIVSGTLKRARSRKCGGHWSSRL